MRVTCGVLAILYGVVIGLILGPLLVRMHGDGPAWMDKIVKGFAGAATLGAWGLIAGGLAVLLKKFWGVRLLLSSSAIVLTMIYVGTAMVFGQYVDGHMSVLIITPFLAGLIVLLRWTWLQRGRSDFNSPLSGNAPRPWQFTIRFLLLLTFVTALWFSWRAANLQQSRRETQVVAELGKAASTVGKVGGSITVVTLNASAGDDHLRLLAQLPSLRFLTIEKSRISDDALTHLASLTLLISLELRDVPISCEALRHLGPLHLQLLTLSGLRDVGAGLEQLHSLSEMKSVNLDLSGTNLTDGDTVHLAGLKALTVLRLNGTPIGDRTLACLAATPQLGVLDLGSTQVTDAGLEHLTGLSRLRSLSLDKTQVTDEGVKRLQQALPNCRIRR